MPRTKRYAIKEIFGPTLQGEAVMAGTPCKFVRFAGCNMWDGRPETREQSQCPYCDTDFFGGTLWTADEILQGLADLPTSPRWVWVSGGEPMLQLDRDLVWALHDANYLIGVETNGTTAFPEGLSRYMISHLVVSPKVRYEDLKIRSANVLKLLYPHPNPAIRPENYQDFGAAFKYLQPIDTGDPVANEANLRATIDKLHELRTWQLSLQTHKILGVA